MSILISVRYDGETQTTAVHGPSGGRLRTVAPRDNGGDGSAFSPTDLFATSAATCTLTILAMRAIRKGLDVTGATAVVEKVMSTEGPRRIARLPIVMRLPIAPGKEAQAELEAHARACPVHQTLIGAAIDAPIAFEWGVQID